MENKEVFDIAFDLINKMLHRNNDDELQSIADDIESRYEPKDVKRILIAFKQICLELTSRSPSYKVPNCRMYSQF